MRRSFIVVALAALALLSASCVEGGLRRPSVLDAEEPLVHRHPAASPLMLRGSPSYPMPTLDQCATCKAAVANADANPTNSTELELVAAQLNAACQVASESLVCDMVAAVFLSNNFEKKLQKSGYYTPDILCSVIQQCGIVCCTDNAPTQIHLSAAGDESEMVVTWVTGDNTADTQVEYGLSPDALDMRVDTVVTRTSTAGAWLGSIHVATLTSLAPNTQYFYRVGGDFTGWSKPTAFMSRGPMIPANKTYVVVGDMGQELNYSQGNQDWINYAASSQAPTDQTIQGVLYIGDISYANGYEERWDALFNYLEPSASSIPIMTVPGNHEVYFNFTSYQMRLEMPTVASKAPVDGMYYSWDDGCVHFIGLNTESEIDTVYISAAQVAWLKADLEAVSARREAAKQIRTFARDTTCSTTAPTFTVVYMHRPVYCSAGSKSGKERCTLEAAYLQSLVEDLFYQHGVDLVFAGHVHGYERNLNVYKSRVDPKGPVYILNGVGGNLEGQEMNWMSPSPAYSVTRAGDVGLGTLTVVDRATMVWNFFKQADLVQAMATGTSPAVSDTVTIQARQ